MSKETSDAGHTDPRLAALAELIAANGKAKRPPLVRVLDTRGKRPAELLEQLQRLWPTARVPRSWPAAMHRRTRIL